jgi:hypothetical protein
MFAHPSVDFALESEHSLHTAQELGNPLVCINPHGSYSARKFRIVAPVSLLIFFCAFMAAGRRISSGNSWLDGPARDSDEMRSVSSGNEGNGEKRIQQK